MTDTRETQQFYELMMNGTPAAIIEAVPLGPHDKALNDAHMTCLAINILRQLQRTDARCDAAIDRSADNREALLALAGKLTQVNSTQDGKLQGLADLIFDLAQQLGKQRQDALIATQYIDHLAVRTDALVAQVKSLQQRVSVADRQALIENLGGKM